MSEIRPHIESSWLEVLKEEFNEPYFISLKDFLVQEKLKHQIFPPGPLMFNAFDITPFQKVRVVILGQDPYHGPGQAHGLCFSVPDGIPAPPSLKNILKELQGDLGFPIPKQGNLELWAHQGVLLLNATLTVRAHEAGSHQNRGWETFTDKVISLLSLQRPHLVFVLWGNFARAKKKLIDTSRHLVLESAHPSPLSAYQGFFGCRHFSKANQWLEAHALGTVDWNLNPDTT